MENQKQGVKLDVTIKSVYTLDKNKISGVRDFKDKSNYLYKDGASTPVMCPFMSSIAMDWHTKQHVLAPYPCGSFCQHFHIAPEIKKIFEPVEGSDKKVEKTIPTGGVKVGLSCGSAGVWFSISGLALPEEQASPVAESNPQSHLKVVKKEGEE